MRISGVIHMTGKYRHPNVVDTRVSIEGVKKLCIDFSNNQKLGYVKYHIYGQCKKLLKNLLKSEFIMVKIVKNQLKI